MSCSQYGSRLKQCEVCLKLTTDQTKMKEYMNEVIFYNNHYLDTIPPNYILRRLEWLYTKIVAGFKLIRSRNPTHIDEVIDSYEKSRRWIIINLH